MLQPEHSYKVHKCKLTADFGCAPGMVAGEAQLCFGLQHGQELFHQAQALVCMAGLYPPPPVPWGAALSWHSCKDVTPCHLCWRLWGQLGFMGQGKHHLLTLISALPTTDIYHLEHRSRHTSLFRSQDNPPQHCPDWDALSCLWFNASSPPRRLGRNPKTAVSLIRLCSKTQRLPNLLLFTASSRTPWRRPDLWWLFSPAPFPGQSSPTPLIVHLSYYITPCKCRKVFQHHCNAASEDEK